jgi:hypothetical protein
MSCSCPVNSSAGNWCKVLMTSSKRCSWLCPPLLPRCRHSSVCTGQPDVSHSTATLVRRQTVLSFASRLLWALCWLRCPSSTVPQHCVLSPGRCLLLWQDRLAARRSASPIVATHDAAPAQLTSCLWPLICMVRSTSIRSCFEVHLRRRQCWQTTHLLGGPRQKEQQHRWQHSSDCEVQKVDACTAAATKWSHSY